MRTLRLATFTTALLSGTSGALAMTQDEAIAAIRQQVRDGGGAPAGGAYAWMAIVALALSVVLLVIRWRRGERARKPSLNDPHKLLKELRREAGLSRADLRQLRRDAADVHRNTGQKLPSPLLTILCPSLKAKRHDPTT